MNFKPSKQVVKIIIFAIIFVLLVTAVFVSAWLAEQDTPWKENTFAETTKLPVNGYKNVVNYSITGEAQLNTKNSMIRVILLSKDGKEYLVYEAKGWADGVSKKIQLQDACHETCAFGPVDVADVKVFVNDATIKITSTKYEKSDIAPSAEVVQASLKKISQEKLKKVQQMIKDNNLEWIAGETSVSSKTYEEKKGLWGEGTNDLPDLCGFEYYKGGIFTWPPCYFLNEQTTTTKSKEVIKPTVAP